MKPRIRKVCDKADALLLELSNWQATHETPEKLQRMPPLNQELRSISRLLKDAFNASSGAEREYLEAIFKRVSSALNGWEYQMEVDISNRRIAELQRRLQEPLNATQTRKAKRELARIFALRRKFRAG
jgi:hypothetical protein